MTAPTRPDSGAVDLADIESGVADSLADDVALATALDVVDDDAGDDDAGDDDDEDDGPPSTRAAVAVGCSVAGAAVMVGGIFLGVAPRFYAVVGGLLGVGLAVLTVRIKSSARANVAVPAGLFAVGLIVLLPSGPENVLELRTLIREAAAAGDALRPPVPFLPGWQVIIGWLMGVVGFLSGWLALSVRRPALGLLLPLPVAAFAGISVPDDAQVPSGIAVMILFALALGVLSSAQVSEAGERRPDIGFEVRRALRALPLLALVTVILAALSTTDFLFPDPIIDPAQEPQKPRSVPLSEVEDRVLFEVESTLRGPWRVGSLDVYDGRDWRLPPFDDNQLEPVRRDGVVDDDLRQQVQATFIIAGLTGAVLPGLPNTVGILASGPLLAYDQRNGNIRLVAGQVTAGLRYQVVAAGLPSLAELRALDTSLPKSVKPFTEIGEPPPAAADLIDEARRRFDNQWDRFDFLRTWVLDNVTATGPGAPVSITPQRVQDMVAGSKEATPFEIVAAQAMFARWIGVPSRIGYGFDGGEEVGGRLQVRPRNGASFVEVFFPGFKWLPVIGTPKKAKPTQSASGAEQRTDPNILPSDDIAVRLVFPIVTDAPSIFSKQIQRVLLVGVPLLLLLGMLYVLYPVVRKAIVRSRRRARARRAGPRARVALAYAEWRDLATDFGCFYPTDLPLAFLARFITDDEHRELAWLATRALWGDLREGIESDAAEVADELSRALRRRLALAQPATLRAVAAVSRLSLRNPFPWEVGATWHGLEDYDADVDSDIDDSRRADVVPVG